MFGFIAFTLLRGWFVIEVDSTRLALVGLGSRRVDLPWGELDAAGLIDWNGTRLLAVRPRRPWPSSTDPFIWRWDQERGLLLIAGLVNWSRPPDEMVEIMRTYAGAKWTDPIAEPVPSDQSPPK